MKLKDITLLFIEDDPLTGEMIRDLLEKEVHRLYLAESGEEGWESFLERRPQLVVSDINLPGLSGLQLARKIRTLDESIPILIVSAFDQKEILIEALNSQIDGYLLKPLNVMELMDKLQKAAAKVRKVRDDEAAIHTKIKELERKAHYDAVTGLPNRTFFESSLAESLRRAEESAGENVALFLIDLDRFKTINDRYGHITGDKVLRTVAESMRKVQEEENTLFRIGGDEFAMIVNAVSSEEKLQKLGERLHEASQFEMENEGERFRVTCSIGGCSYPFPASSRSELLTEADKALYRSKEAGRATYRICPFP